MKIGSANYNQSGSKKHYHKLAKGEGVVGVFRSVPPIGDLACQAHDASQCCLHFSGAGDRKDK